MAGIRLMTASELAALQLSRSDASEGTDPTASLDASAFGEGKGDEPAAAQGDAPAAPDHKGA